MNINKSLKINTILNVIKTLMSLIFPLITFPYASRVLMPEGLGKVNFSISIVSYFAIIASLGIDNYGIREASKIRDDKSKLSKFTKEVFIINLISTSIAYILFFIALFVVPKFSEYRIVLIVVSSTILFTTLGMNWLYTALEEFFYITLRSLCFQIVSLILLFLTVHTSDDYIKYAAISVISNVGSNVMNFIYSRKFIQIRTKVKLEFKKHLKPIFILFSMAVTVQVYTVLDTSMLGFIKGDRAVGLYSTASKFSRMVLYLVQAFAPVIYPRLSYYSQLEDKTDFFNLVNKGLNFLFLIAMPCTIGLSILTPQIIKIMCGLEYVDSIIPMLILNPIVFILATSSFIGVQVFMPLNKEKWSLLANITAAITNMILNFLLIPKFGVIGAAIASIVAESANLLIALIFVKKYIKLLPLFKHFMIYTCNSIVMGIFVYLSHFVSSVLWIQLLIGILVGIVTYFILLLIERNYLLLNFLKSVKNKLVKTDKEIL